MTLDTFERFKLNEYLSPISSGTLVKIGERCGLSESFIVLDVGSGKGGAAITLAEKFNCVVTGTESRVDFAEEARRRTVFEDLDHFVNILDTPNDELPFDDDYFDLVIMLGHTNPYNTLEKTGELRRIVRPGGWIALSEMTWKDGAHAATSPVREWAGGFAPDRIAGIEERVAEFREGGYMVEFAEIEPDASWEAYYAPQAKVILENRREHSGSSGELSVLDQWQKDLHLYHTGGGKESLGYAYYLLRSP
jgi:SAM-dependent methyltransferase